MKYALYTGCVAKGAGRELLAAANLVCEKLGVELAEMTDAACCGAGVIGEDNPMVADILNARTFSLAEAQGLDIMNICATCQGVHRKAQRKLEKDPELHGAGERRAQEGHRPRVQGDGEGQALLRGAAPGDRPGEASRRR